MLKFTIPTSTSVLLIASAWTLGLGVARPASAAAEDWPTRPVTLVVTVATGSSNDVAARTIVPRLSELLGKQIIIENISGAGGMAGAARVAKARPDGYEFVLGNVGTHAMNQTLYKSPLYNAANDFAPVALVYDTALLLTTRKNLPAGNLAEFIAYARENQAKMQFGSPGAGNPAHLACALLNAAIGVNITHVPYRGGGPAMQDLIAGRIDYQCPGTAIAVPQIDGGTIKAIAALTKNRSPILPNLASAHEQGLTDFDAAAWTAFFLPKGTPAQIIQRLHDATVAAMDTPSVRDRLAELGDSVVAPERRSSEYLQEFVKSEIGKWAGPIKAANIDVN
jgi:tripartite-type tricarboxylate transporter receptor subunit TctC